MRFLWAGVVSAKAGCVARFFATQTRVVPGPDVGGQEVAASSSDRRGSDVPGQTPGSRRTQRGAGDPRIAFDPHSTYPRELGVQVGRPRKGQRFEALREGRWLGMMGGGANPLRGPGELIFPDTRAGWPEPCLRKEGGRRGRPYASRGFGGSPSGRKPGLANSRPVLGRGRYPLYRHPGRLGHVLFSSAVVPGALEPRTGKGSKQEGKKGGRREPGVAIMP